MTDTNQYEFISQATVTNGEYGAWSVPVIWAKYGADGSDAAVTDENVFQALTSNGTMYGCFTALDNKLYINAAYIQSGTVSSDLTYTGKLIANNADITGKIIATSGTFSDCTIDNTCTINGTITANDISANVLPSIYNAKGTFQYLEGGEGEYHLSDEYKLMVTSDGYYGAPLSAVFHAGVQYGNLAALEMKTQRKNQSGTTEECTIGLYSAERDSDGVELGSRAYISARSIELWAGNNIWLDPGNNGALRGTWNAENPITVNSDRRIKSNIQDIPNSFSALFDSLKPRIFRYNYGKSGRYHTGFVAQELGEAMELAGINSKDFAALCIEQEGSEHELWGIRYEEIIPINTYEIQKLKARVFELEKLVGR